MGANKDYVTQQRGIAKIVEIVLGFLLCSMLCGQWYGGRSCFYNGQYGFASGVNFIFLVANIVFLVLNLTDVLGKDLNKFETYYAIAGAIFFLIAAVLIVWAVFIDGLPWEKVVSAVLVVSIFLLFAWEVQILRGKA